MRFLNITACGYLMRLSILSVFFATITPISTHAEMSNFSLRYGTNIKGNIKTIGNTLMQANPTNTASNGGSNMVYVDIDGNASTFSSSSADINSTENGLDITTASVVWAGLYWQGYLHTWDAGDGPNTNDQYTNLNTLASITNIVNTHSITFTTPTGTYSITPDDLGIRTNQGGNGVGYNTVNYGAFTDVTSLLSGISLPGTYTVANVPTQQGNTSLGAWNDGLGNYGAWTLVVIYDNHTSMLEKTRNFSVYDGYVTLSGTNDPTNPLNTDEDITFTGFKTPKKAPNGVDSVISIFAGEGDARLGASWGALDDSARIFNQDGDEYVLPNPPGRTNYFSSAIDGVPIRNPIINDNKGIDIHVQQIGTIDGNDRPIKINHTSATLNLRTRYDTYMPSMVSFSTELYVPKICYDYTIQKNGFDITDSADGNRTFSTVGSSDISINLLIKSEDGDFDFVNSKLSIWLDPQNNTNFTQALYSPDNVNAFIPAVPSEDDTAARPSISIGELPDTTGGTIKASQRYYNKFLYHIDSSNYAGKFDFELKTSIDFGSGPAPFSISSASNTIRRCDQTKKYEPTYGSFNVERVGSSGAPSQKYPLYTQITGKDFDFEVVAYTNPPNYSNELNLNGYTVDVELINVRPFNDENSTFTCNNPDPAIIQAFTASGSRQVFAKFAGSSRVNMASLNIQTDTALRNAAFRVWTIVDENDTIIKYNCSSPSDDACFQTLYNTYLQASDTSGACSNCSSYTNAARGASGCYACLRDHFSKPVCSRDNFSIRPAAYRLGISDSGESATPPPIVALGENSIIGDDPIATLAAGYKYRLDGNATSFVGDDTIAKGYTTAFDNQNDNMSSVLHFNGSSSSYDQNNTLWDVYFSNSTIEGTVNNGVIALDSGNLLSHGNVGKYFYNIHDKEWTLVDQRRYPHKTFDTDDCIPDDNSIDSSGIGKSGCDIDSKLTIGDTIYNDMHLMFQPYSFDMSDISLIVKPNGAYLFMTDLSNDYYETTASLLNPMAIVYEGNLTAMSKNGNVTTNFTAAAAASDLRINIKRESNASEETLEDEYNITMQQSLSYGSDVDISTTFNDTKYGKDANLTLSRVAFEDNTTWPGSARIRVYTTFKKPSKSDLSATDIEGIDPIRTHFLDINSAGDDANSSAHMGSYIPMGTHAHDQNVTFLYAKVSPNKKEYTSKDSDSIVTPINILSYCSFGVAECSDFELNATSVPEHESSAWYHTRSPFELPEDIGNTDLKVSELTVDTMEGFKHDAKLKLDSGDDTSVEDYELKAVGYALDGRQQDLKVYLLGSRFTKVRIRYQSVPWLEYDFHEQFYDVIFPGGRNLMWSGHGKTGHVVGDNIREEKTKRLEW